MEKEASQLEKDHVHHVYEKIAPHFSDARYKAWPKVQKFISNQELGSLIADIGCGNGKYLHINSKVYKLGCDYCFPLVETARNDGHEVMLCHSLCLPYRNECFDAVLSIADSEVEPSHFPLLNRSQIVKVSKVIYFYYQIISLILLSHWKERSCWNEE
ncbi:probable tRNA methyltransferase 9B isoform X3 [Alligator mississippiensis]|uniref:probable tRNA methyltransferase 9B isoform X3 n=1 Tax=Alligator mississippiensis TaxID=8496 RepID=UPI002877B95A|nr:probable tRNA methyltransferase 9B isoform X3 [Alligator mississippiensis]